MDAESVNWAWRGHSSKLICYACLFKSGARELASRLKTEELKSLRPALVGLGGRTVEFGLAQLCSSSGKQVKHLFSAPQTPLPEDGAGGAVTQEMWELGSDQTVLGNFISERQPDIESVTSRKRWRLLGKGGLVSHRSLHNGAIATEVAALSLLGEGAGPCLHLSLVL